MLNELVGQFLKSSDGGALLQQLQAKGLTEQQATSAVTATAEGAVEQGSPGGAGGLDLASLAGGLLGGGGGLGAMLGAFGGAAPAAGAAPANPMAGLVGPVSQFVAQKTGLALPMALMVVSTVLPKVMSLFGGATTAPAAGEATAAAASPVESVLSNLFR